MFWIHFWNWFVKITGWPAQLVCFRTKIHYEDKKKQGRSIHGPAIIISNHTSVFDYVVMLFTFPGRTVRVQMAELLFEKKPLGLLLKLLGGIRVDRNSHDFGFVEKSCEILEKGGVVGIYPESRIPRPGEARPLEFKTSAAFTALRAGVPVIPIAVNGSYFRKKRSEMIIGTPMDVTEFTLEDASDRENIRRVNDAMRARIRELTEKLEEAENE